MKTMLLLIVLLSISHMVKADDTMTTVNDTQTIEQSVEYKECVTAALADDSGYEVDESEAAEYCLNNNY